MSKDISVDEECAAALAQINHLEANHYEAINVYNQSFAQNQMERLSNAQQEYLSERIKKELSALKSQLDATYFAWGKQEWNEEGDHNQQYESLRSAEMHVLPLENQSYSDVIFNQLIESMQANDLNEIIDDGNVDALQLEITGSQSEQQLRSRITELTVYLINLESRQSSQKYTNRSANYSKPFKSTKPSRCGFRRFIYCSGNP